MKRLRFMTAFALTAAFMGCVNLKTVQDFAAESAKFSAYTELTTRFRDTYQRELPYVSGQTAQLAQANDAKRKAAYPDLVKIQRNIAIYMRTLATLAGDKTFDFSKSLESIESGIKAHPDFGINAKEVDAFSNLSKVAAKWLASAYQDKAVRDLLREADPPLQDLLDGLAALVSHYKQTNENERSSVLGLLEVEIAYADTPKDLLLATLAKAHLQSKIQEYQLADSLYAEAEKGIKRIQEGHRALVEHADRLSSEEAKTVISTFTKEIKAIRNNLQTIHAW